MVPVQVGQEEVVDRRVAGGDASERVDAELAQARAHVADHERAVAALDLDAGGAAAVGAVGGEVEVFGGEGRGLRLVLEDMAAGGHQGLGDLRLDGGRVLGDRQGAARAPEAYEHAFVLSLRRPPRRCRPP